MFKNFIPLVGLNNWQSSWIMRVAESIHGKPLTGHKRNLLYSIFYGLFAGVFLAALELCFSIFLFNHPFTGELLLVSGAVFLKFTVFVFLVSMLLTEADVLKEKVKNNRNHEFILTALINSGAFLLVILISLVFYFYFYTPTKYYSAAELHPEVCQNEKCEVSTIPLVPNLTEVSEKKLPKVEEGKGKVELGAGISFDTLSKEEFDKFLDDTGFESFNIKTTEAKATASFSDISLFQDKDVDWEQFLVELDDVALKAPHYVDMKISSAIRKEVPLEIINDILNRGHELNGDHVTSLATYFTVEEFQHLENYGIDLSEGSSIGGSTLDRSLLNKHGPELFEYLLTKDELVMAEDINVVKEALFLSSKLNRPVKYIQQLIERGAPMTDETREWIETDLRKNNLNYYVIVKSRLTY